MQKRIEKLLEQGYEGNFIKLIEKLESKVALHVDLQKIVDALGNTPIAEPKLFTAVQEAIEEGKSVIALALLSEEELNKYTAVQIGDLIHVAEMKITSLENEDGTYKSTPNTENCNLPNYIESENILKQSAKEQKLRKDIVLARQSKMNDKALKNTIEKFNKASKELEALVMGISGLDAETLTPWETGLVATTIFMSCRDASLSSLGKRY